MHAGLRRGIHAVRRKIFHFAMQQQPQRTAAIRFTEVKHKAMRFGESLKLRQSKIAKVTMREQIGQHIVSMLVPCAGWRTRIFALAHHHFEFWIRRIRREIFVRIHIEIGRMIDRHQARLIEINRFLQRLHKTEAELAIFFADGIAIDLDVFDRPRNVALVGPDPVSNDPAPSMSATNS